LNTAFRPNPGRIDSAGGKFLPDFPVLLFILWTQVKRLWRTGGYDGAMHPVRIDKWLWAARFYKTRALAARACDLGRVRSNGAEAKPAREVRVGDMLEVRNDSGDFQIEVLLLSEVRGPAAVAQTLYRETGASREARLKVAEERKVMREYAPIPERRPTKRDRRRIIQFRGGA